MKLLKSKDQINIIQVPFYMNIENDGSKDGKCRMSGLVGSQMMDILKNLWEGKCNLIWTPGLGVFDGNNSYTGALGMVQRDVSNNQNEVLRSSDLLSDRRLMY